MPTFHEQHDWYFRAAALAGVRGKGQAERELRKASALSEEVLTRLYDIRARLDELFARAIELDRDARPDRTFPRP
jgi:hypothetical protein